MTEAPDLAVADTGGPHDASPDLASIPFGPLSITYDRRVLEPRPWTTAQSAWATELLRDAPGGPVLELCAGAGQIGLLAIAPTERTVVAVDANPVAGMFTRINAGDAGLAERVEVRTADLAAAIGPAERFALVIADPPWVETARVPEYVEDPVAAIDGGADGLGLARACLQVAARHLLPGGSVLLQLGGPRQVARIWHEALEETWLDLRPVEHRDHPGSGALLRLERSLER